MKPRLRIPRALVVAVIGVSAASACGDDNNECIRCVTDPRIGDAGVEDAPPCPVCLPKDGVCGPGCIPEGFG